ncbi:energy transducer TonB [Microbulbifer sp. TRSA001]|uniref:energy transducer TonB n=1 Tax=Microbulbifer sp. TRSA001 TaxID=3243381 RepID=UPI004039973B
MRVLALAFLAITFSGCTSNSVSFSGCTSYEQCPKMIYSLKASDESREAAKQKGEPVPLFSTPPIYPLQAVEEKIEGFVVVEFNVDVDGQVTDPKVVNSNPAGVFDESALAAVMHTRYEPLDQKYYGYGMKYNFDYPFESDHIVCRTDKVLGSRIKKAKVCVDRRKTNPLIDRIRSGTHH